MLDLRRQSENMVAIKDTKKYPSPADPRQRTKKPIYEPISAEC